jgi:6-phosphogluconolactonase
MTGMHMNTEILADRQALAIVTARRLDALARQAIMRQGHFSLALSGGSTPRDLYRSLATAPVVNRIDWKRVHLFWGDERCVPPDHADSNFAMVQDALLSQVPVPSGNIHRIRGEIDPHAAADAYEDDLRQFFPAAAPRFDLILLGMGSDGHTASLFPASPAVVHTLDASSQRWVVANTSDGAAPWRVTLTPLAINAAAQVIFLVAGRDKAATLNQVLNGPFQPRTLPAQLIRPTHGDLIWMVDAGAASLLS